jgi:hypothetical protein
MQTSSYFPLYQAVGTESVIAGDDARASCMQTRWKKMHIYSQTFSKSCSRSYIETYGMFSPNLEPVSEGQVYPTRTWCVKSFLVKWRMLSSLLHHLQTHKLHNLPTCPSYSNTQPTYMCFLLMAGTCCSTTTLVFFF